MDVKLTLGVGILCVLLMWGFTPVNATPENPPADKTTGKAPDFTLKDVDGNDVKLSDFAGKVVVLEWVNYDCPFVKYHYSDDVRTMENLARKYKAQGVVWLTINSTHYVTPASIKEWAGEKGIEDQILLVDTDGTVGHKYHAKTTPHMFVIDKNGTIVYQGAIDNAPLGHQREGEAYVNYVDRALTEVLAGKAVSIPETKPYGCTVKYPPKEKAAAG
jgi:peroxiredoxin